MIKKKEKTKGLWIDQEILNVEELQPIDRLLLAKILSYLDKGECYASNQYLGKYFHVSPSTISNSIKRLKKHNLIRQVGFDGHKRYLGKCNGNGD
ncbi:helix-turn-helix domain-containing protein [bacterium]|nr:helix-turn-helix domain-containing protein [bacterium]